jgi:hypothetical protein
LVCKSAYQKALLVSVFSVFLGEKMKVIKLSKYEYIKSRLELFKALKNELIKDYEYLKKKSSEGDSEAEKLANEIIEVIK